MSKVNLSIILITKNEEKNIRECLDSVSWIDEIVIVDSGSTDRTLEICREYTHQIFVNEHWKGFGYQKSMALKKVTNEWVLSIDADERVSTELKNEIELAIGKGNYSAYSIPRQAYFLGKAMRHGGWWPDYVVRLFKRDIGRFSDDIIHERVIVEESIKKLKNPLIHYSYVSLDQLMRKMNIYSAAGAKKLSSQGKNSNLLIALTRGFWAFFRAFIIRGGVLDGQMGLIAAISKGEETYYKYLKLVHLIKG